MESKSSERDLFYEGRWLVAVGGKGERGKDHDPFAIEILDGFLGRGCHDGRLDFTVYRKFRR